MRFERLASTTFLPRSPTIPRAATEGHQREPGRPSAPAGRQLWAGPRLSRDRPVKRSLRSRRQEAGTHTMVPLDGSRMGGPSPSGHRAVGNVSFNHLAGGERRPGRAQRGGQDHAFNCICGQLPLPTTGRSSSAGTVLDGLPTYQRAAIGDRSTYQRWRCLGHDGARAPVVASGPGCGRLWRALCNRSSPRRPRWPG